MHTSTTTPRTSYVLWTSTSLRARCVVASTTIDLHSCVKRAEHENVRARIAFAEGYSRWTEEDWSHAMFSDETHFYLGHHGREYVQRPPGTALDPKYTRKENQQLKGKVSLWGCICAGGLGHAEL